MSTMTVIEPTPVGTEEDVVPQHDGPTVRVAMREIREYAYRALVAAGASAGEAATAAGQVLHAELHAGNGLAGLVVDLTRGPWPSSGLACTRTPAGSQILEVDCGGRSGELRVGAPIIELVAGQDGPAVAVTTADVPVTALLDEALLSAATSCGTSVTAMRARPDGAYVVRLATPEGELAHGALSDEERPFLPGVGRIDQAEALVVITGAEVGSALARLARSTHDSRVARRRQAASHGVRVDETTWAVVTEYARRFLVPEEDS